MSRRRLSFNPYSVSDSRLLEIAETTGWGGIDDITQITIVKFTRLREVRDIREFDGVFMTVADKPEEIFLSTGQLIHPITALDCLQQMRNMIGKTYIRNSCDVAKLVGKSYFVSRIIPGKSISGNSRGIYRMYRIRGDVAKDARTIRDAMCAAKIEMLQRLLQYGESSVWLDCQKELFDFEPRIRQAIESIRHFPDHPIPQD